MTSQEMQYNFELKLNEQKSLEKSFISYDVAMFLNASQNDLVEGFYSSRINPGSRYFEMDERARAMLALLIESTTILAAAFDSTSTELHDNAVFATLPADFLYALKEECVVSYTDCNSITVNTNARVLPVRHDEYSMNIENTYKKPWRKLVWRMDFGDTGGRKKHELIYGSGNAIVSYKLRYLRKPVAIDIIGGVDCELHEILHEEVVDRAVAIALRSVPKEEPNLQT
jgi:hypothetical protein